MNPRQPLLSNSPVSEEKPLASLNNYSGNQNPRYGLFAWVPLSWIGHLQLMRLVPPVGIILIFLPHVFGLLHASIRLNAPPGALVSPFAILLLGSVFVSNASHIWNDLIDADLDAKVSRTSRRPIPRGAVSPSAAVAVMVVQVLVALVCLYLTGSSGAWALGAVTAVAIAYYPFGKRHMHFPQFVLGLCMASAVMMGELAIDKQYLSQIGTEQTDQSYRTNGSILCLMGAVLLWTVIYDTIYAHQDFEQDTAAGIRSFTILCGRQGTKPVLCVLLSVMAILLAGCGFLSGFGILFCVPALGGAITSLALMIVKVELNQEESCWWWFSKGFWYPGGSIVAGLFLEYIFGFYARGILL